MKYTELRNELAAFYQNNNRIEPSYNFAVKCKQLFEEELREEMTVTAQKLLQYDIIVREFEPVLFGTIPFYYETGTLTSLSDGARDSKGADFVHAGGMTYERNKDIFIRQDPELWKRRSAQGEENLYLICGPYNDVSQHFNFNHRPILEHGLKGIYEHAEEMLELAENQEETEFLNAVCQAMLQLKKAADKFSRKAEEMLRTPKDRNAVRNLELIKRTAKRVPWEKPETLYEALNTLAFMRKMLGTLEGIGPNTFGRLDMDLYPFYEKDIQNGVSPEEEYELICQFLLIWDMHYDHDMLMEGYADHELENTYTLGGCDRDGNPLYNELTQMFLQATREEKIIFPKIKCRYSKESPGEYLDEINRSVISGTSTILYQNDDATIPAIVRAGRTLDAARDYLVSGCWGIVAEGEKYDHGCYLNLLKPFEFALHHLTEKMKKVGLEFQTYDSARSFEEVYQITIENCRRLMEERIEITRKGGQVWSKADVLPIFSSTLQDCLEKRKDFTCGGGRYHDDYLLCFGLPNIVDSLMVIRKLCFETGKYSLQQILDAVRNNWNGYEELRTEAIHCSGWGDGGEESTELANRFNNDLFQIASGLEGSYGGKVHIGHVTYTEIRWWGDKTLATPDGRYNGEYFAQGLTPSRLKKIPSVTNVIRSMAGLDASTMAANSVVNIILPSSRISLDICAGFLRSVAESAVMSLQLNCVTREQLLDAQKHPEEYQDLIIRVCGFSARFTSLSPGWQDEVLSRNFYE